MVPGIHSSPQQVGLFCSDIHHGHDQRDRSIQNTPGMQHDSEKKHETSCLAQNVHKVFRLNDVVVKLHILLATCLQSNNTCR